MTGPLTKREIDMTLKITRMLRGQPPVADASAADGTDKVAAGISGGAADPAEESYRDVSRSMVKHI